MRDIGFIDAAKKGDITFAVFHILGPSIASLDEIADTAAYLGDAKYFMVKNFINNTHFFEWDEATHSSYFKRIKDAVEITIPKLSEMATEQVELASVPFVTFIANKKRKARRRPIRSCCGAMCGIGSGGSGQNMIVSTSPTLWKHGNLPGRPSAGRAPSSRLRRHSGLRASFGVARVWLA